MDIIINSLLVAAALLPAIILCVYIYKKDRVEKEPIGLLILLLLGGMFICFPGGLIEGLFDEVMLAPLFKDHVLGYAQDGAPVYSDAIRHIKDFLFYFFGVGLVEEGLKFIVLILLTRNHREFNSLFDGIIYAIFVSLGFAALENVFYVLENGFWVALMRAVLSVPGHMFFAVMMGYYYSLWHISDKAILMERAYKVQGLINPSAPGFKGGKYAFLSIFVPTVAHGTYDFCCVYGTDLSLVVLICFVIFMYIYCFNKIRKMSVGDAPSANYAYAMIIKKYPSLPDAISARNAELEAQANRVTQTQAVSDN